MLQSSAMQFFLKYEIFLKAEKSNFNQNWFVKICKISLLKNRSGYTKSTFM